MPEAVVSGSTGEYLPPIDHDWDTGSPTSATAATAKTSARSGAMLKAAPRPVTATLMSAHVDSEQYDHSKRTICDRWYSIARKEAMIGSCVQPRTLSTFVA